MVADPKGRQAQERTRETARTTPPHGALFDNRKKDRPQHER